MINKNTVIKKKSSLDKFYTKKEVAQALLETIVKTIPQDNLMYLEPAAGNGSFIQPLIKMKKEFAAYDIQPEHKSIKKANFFDLDFKKIAEQKVATIGNPPFGRVSSLAIRFFNHAAEFSDYICFIVPKTFRKDSIKEKLNSHFWLIHDEELPKNSFLLNDKAHDVPCCFQIWERRKEERLPEEEIIIDLFEYTKKPSEADLAIRRVGGNAGKLVENNLEELSTQSHYFIILNDISKDKFIKKYKMINFKSVVNNTAGIRSLSKKELAKFIDDTF